ncbi:methyltransferase [Monoraphidium neglectum]|uniref:Methyltransferase n=1 Tax=Monoraphidium neglectum TaxID=145388 RepID=A0A0D2N5Y6_9CHLO|nr:methyltransferase [Monoraphidium neglectum]KIZ07652.1 methyltransferase [Monoraphidium neglectum]|eukprot:XP_013906671.1 methyltransferase [Monoraphidium neglectum]
MAAAAIAANPSLAAAPWADLGTGSGALAIGLGTLLSKQQQLQQQQQHQHQHQQETEGAAAGSSPAVWAVDFSPSAAAYAAANAAACTPPGAVRVVVGSWWEPLGHLRGQLGGVLTNPPYIPRAQMEGLQREVGLHEPHSALDGGPGPGLDSIQVICAGAGEMLMDGGYIALETAGDDQAARVKSLLESSGDFEGAGVVADCYGVGRFVEARRRRR